VYLTANDFWMVPVLGHPPLIEGWAALPLLLNPDRPRPTEVPHWKENAALYIQSLLPRLGSVAQLEVATRVPVMLLATLLLALTFRWASDLAGWWGGICAVILMVWDPTMIAHAQLDTTDLGVTLLMFADVYVFWKLVHRPTWYRVVATGLLSGLVMAAKHSGVIALPLVGLLAVWGWYWTEREERRAKAPSDVHCARPISRMWVWGGWAAAIVAIAVLVLWAVYRFEIERQATFPWVVPFPSHIKSLRGLFESKDRLAFLRGHLREGGWWWYYPYVFLVKTPLPFIAAILFSVYTELRQGRRAWLRDIPLWLFPVLYWGIAIRGGMHIGYRHLLPTLPFIYVLVGRAIAQAPFLHWRPGRWVAAALATWYIMGTWRVYPYTIAYFNELIGGPANGYRHLVDSNVDWGQGFKVLAHYMQQADIAEVRLSYYTWVDPAVYGVMYTPLPPAPRTENVRFPSFAPPAGVYAISATTLQGILVRDLDLYAWFRQQTPIAQPGYGLLVYRVEHPDPVPAWVSQCSTPVSPLPSSEIERGFGGLAQRVASFDCSQAWLYPGGGRTAGWFVLHPEARRGADAWVSSRLAEARLSYVKERSGTLPPYSIYEWTSSLLSVPEVAVHIPLDPVSPVGGLTVSAPISFDGPLALQGYQIVPAGEQGFELWAWWEVKSPTLRPFSLMGHLVDAAGHTVGVADGLGVPLTEMRQGDWFVQRHRFLLSGNVTAGLDELWFQTGGYWLDTLERWPILVDGKAVGDRVVLASVEPSRE
jgi:4-amino-4-deoxy-L-arabinose transferase-like glycosyltransferase